MGGFQNFAISFTIISILAGCLTSYSIAFEQGGPVAVTWGWLLVGLMSTIVALSMAEIASAYPTAGRPLLLGLEARKPGLGLVHGLVQPHRADRRDRRDRLRPRDLRDGAPRTTGSSTRTRRGTSISTYAVVLLVRAAPEPAQGQHDGDAEHDLRVLAHDRRGRHRRSSSSSSPTTTVASATSSPRRSTRPAGEARERPASAASSSGTCS